MRREKNILASLHLDDTLQDIGFLFASFVRFITFSPQHLGSFFVILLQFCSSENCKKKRRIILHFVEFAIHLGAFNSFIHSFLRSFTSTSFFVFEITFIIFRERKIHFNFLCDERRQHKNTPLSRMHFAIATSNTFVIYLYCIVERREKMANLSTRTISLLTL